MIMTIHRQPAGEIASGADGGCPGMMPCAKSRRSAVRLMFDQHRLGFSSDTYDLANDNLKAAAAVTLTCGRTALPQP